MISGTLYYIALKDTLYEDRVMHKCMCYTKICVIPCKIQNVPNSVTLRKGLNTNYLPTRTSLVPQAKRTLTNQVQKWLKDKKL